ncbi:ribosomal protein L7/L12 [Clostridium sp. LIBA-8841]|uniref:ribosomal protein L7/L12 n=1 Tax=Clostridium sp. LIBA-8841 TaxID=2987530 RepID=UPI002AC56A9E|nr:ribosomal protein L7/L12 [Clostridium sp. LIBA-8841]MDZ5253709.1 ribosomal protein L7/L12 [Clostridium sp. LIBA-8841]
MYMDINSIWIIFGVGMLMILVSVITQLRSDLMRIRSTLDRIAEKIGVPDIVTKEEKEELMRLILEDKKVEAIKKYRIITGLGLKEAKEYIDQLSDMEKME